VLVSAVLKLANIIACHHGGIIQLTCSYGTCSVVQWHGISTYWVWR